MIKPYLEVGQIVGTHGVKGELRLQPWCDSPDFLKKFDTLYFDEEGRRAVKVLSCRPHGNIVLLYLEGISDLNAAIAQRGKVLFIDRAVADLPEGSYFISELIGCKVYDADKPDLFYGTLEEVSPTGANDVWHIRAENGKEYLLPAIADVVIETDIANELIKIRPLKGIFDDEN